MAAAAWQTNHHFASIADRKREWSSKLVSIVCLELNRWKDEENSLVARRIARCIFWVRIIDEEGFAQGN
ncbi:hypothetical protein QQP08_009071 [Theobroma cacao]|nr:hypothetical protein QQP08_009071 [Theobroma cacao]